MVGVGALQIPIIIIKTNAKESEILALWVGRVIVEVCHSPLIVGGGGGGAPKDHLLLK